MLDLLPGVEANDADHRFTAFRTWFYPECGGEPDWHCYGEPVRLDRGTACRVVLRRGERLLVRTLETLRPLWAWQYVEGLSDPQRELF